MMTLRTTFFPLVLVAVFSLTAIGQRQNTTNGADITSNLLLIEGGTFNMGKDADKDIVRRVTVSSFYIDATEVTNKDYREFLTWMKTHKPTVALDEMLPDETIWNRYIGGEVGAQLTKGYFRLPAFDYHPVVGVNWTSVQSFLEWKSDRVNEQIAIERGYWTEEMKKEETFSTAAFLKKQHTSENFNLLIPNHRLPTEAEWELAAWALIGKRVYTDQGEISNQLFDYVSTSTQKTRHHSSVIEKYRKKVLRHAKQNPTPTYYDHSKYNLPNHVFKGDINGFGIYNMNDNASEWVQDVYRPISKVIRKINRLDLNPYDKEESKKSEDTKGIKGSFSKKEESPDLLDNSGSERVYKGSNVSHEVKKRSPGYRYSEQIKGRQTTLIGFRCAMTCVRLN